MRIGVNLLTLSHDRYGGVEHYVKHLVSHLIKISDEVELLLFLTKPSRDLFPDFQKQLRKVLIKERHVQSDIYQVIDESRLDIWFSPLHNSYIPNVPVPSVVTIHDVLHTAYPQYTGNDPDWHSRYYAQFVPSFDAVITVSDFSKKEITKHLHIPKEKIHSIYLDASHVFQHLPHKKCDKIKNKYHLDEGYAIYPASYNQHKNHINLLKALVCLRDHFNKQIPLVLTGYAHRNNQVHQSVLDFLKEHDLENQVKILGYVPPEDLPFLYGNAEFMVFPSLYEGFGIPLVEAMKAQCPVVCSNRASIPEVVSDAALQFNPDDPKDIAVNILKLLNPNMRKRLIQKGIERSKIFSWESCAKETLHEFQSVIKGDKQR